jgi:hypothetical protein
MLGRAVVTPDLEPPVGTLLQHRSSDVIEFSLPPRMPRGVEVVLGVRPRGVFRDG